MEIRLNSNQMVAKDIIMVQIGIVWWLYYFVVHIHPWFTHCIIQWSELNFSRKSCRLTIIIWLKFNYHIIRQGRNDFFFPVTETSSFWPRTLVSTKQSCNQVLTPISTINIVYWDWITIRIYIKLQRNTFLSVIILQFRDKLGQNPTWDHFC